VKKVILGVDTSNYRTSLCLADQNGNIISEAKQLLRVKPGKRGLQQSEAVFQHTINLPELAEQLQWHDAQIIAIAVSSRPRPVTDSYMPVFKAGEGFARGIAKFLQVPLFTTSHQEMHIAAGEYSAVRRPPSPRFLAFHLSGGTSELLLCVRTNEGYRIDLLGGTLDLHAGQLIDRVGVALGLPFPSGADLEKLANEAQPDGFRAPATVKGSYFNLSGAETQLLQAVRQGVPPAEIARATEQCIANCLEKVIRFAAEHGHPKNVLIVGGVAANRYIRERLRKRLEHRAVGCTLYFADPAYSGDNAFGTAMIGWAKWNFNLQR
jgi:N6-L-threonylcarbamoyladenine synthase